MPNLGFTICLTTTYFSLGSRSLEGHLYFNPPGASAPLSVGPNRAACGATSGKLEVWFYS